MKNSSLNKINSAVILAGGSSRRLGADKQLLRFDGKLAAVYIAEKLKTVFDEIIIVTNRPELYTDMPYKTVRDIYKKGGPLAGIHAGLTSASSTHVFITACDMPFVSLPFVKLMVNKRQETDKRHSIIAVKWDDGYIEPFNSYYSKSSVRAIGHALDSGRYKVNETFDKKTTFYIKESELKQIPDYRKIFTNLNRAEDLDKFRQIIDEQIFIK